jgi:hypothetical protein
MYLLWTVGSNHQEQRCPDPVVDSTFSTFASHKKTQHVKHRCQVTQGSANITSSKTWQTMLGIILSTSPHSFLHQKADEKRPLLTLSMNLWQLQKWLCLLLLDQLCHLTTLQQAPRIVLQWYLWGQLWQLTATVGSNVSNIWQMQKDQDLECSSGNYPKNRCD